MLLDGAEVDAGTDPAKVDTDGDGRSDGEEVNGAVTSNPLVADTDGDLINDGDEVSNGSDPRDANDFPRVEHLQVDFSGTNGPLELFYQGYLALHEVNSLDSDPINGDPFGVDRLNQPYQAFGGTVNLSISYPNLDRMTFTEDQLNTVKQLIDRSGFLVDYTGTKTNLIRDWIGTDARTISNGNGPNKPTSLRLTLSGLPAGDYLLRTYHHDLQNQSGRFGIRVNDADTAGVLLSDKFRITTSVGDNFADPGAGNDPATLRSTVSQVIRANGTDPVMIDFEKAEGATTEQSFFVLNGFELEPTVDSDQDDVPDAVETALVGDLSRDGTGDLDVDGISDYLEVLLNLNPADPDTDNDGLTDGEELGAGPISASVINITSFDFDPETGMVTLDWSPEVPANVQAGTDVAGGFPEIAAAGVRPPTTFSLPPVLSGQAQVFFRIAGPSAGIGSNPFIADTDGDGLPDGDEVNLYGSDPLSADSDNDGFADAREVADGSDPVDAISVPDQDGDGYSNARELAAGSDPNDANDFPLPPTGALYVDFNSNQDNGGDSATNPDPALSVANHNQKGYQSYHANHEVHAEFALASYSAFETTVTVQPSWPNSTDNRVEQMIDRNDQDAAGVVLGGNDANWQGDQINLLTDWLGIDTRTISGGNGDYDGTNGTATPMDLTLGDLPAGTYHWRSYHHDTENVHTQFLLEISTTGSAGPFVRVMGPGPAGTLSMTDSTVGGTPPSDMVYTGFATTGSSDPASLPSTLNTTFTANGTDPVVLRFTPLSNTGVHRQLWGINGFELTRTGP